MSSGFWVQTISLARRGDHYALRLENASQATPEIRLTYAKLRQLRDEADKLLGDGQDQPASGPRPRPSRQGFPPRWV